MPDPVDNTQPAGKNPLSVASVEYLGFQNADNSSSHRDLGFTGHIGGKWYALFGDTLYCAQGVTDPAKDTPGFHGMVRNAISALTDDPLTVHDLNLNDDSPVPHQKQFVPFNEAWGETLFYGFGGTSLVETDYSSATGALFYLVNANDDGLKGAGVAKVEVINGTPTVTKRFGDKGYWWDATCNPRYGDVATFADPHSGYIYAWGGAPTSVKGWVAEQYIYQVRVRPCDAFDLSKYEYWWGRAGGWKRTPLNKFDCETAVMWGTGQGQVVWNPHYGCYIFVHLSLGGGHVLLRTATKPEGPWSSDIKIYEQEAIDGGHVYAGVAHPYLDESGKTLVISYTNNNHIQVIKVTFGDR